MGDAESGQTPAARPVVLYGAGPLGRLLHYLFSNDSRTPVVAFTVDDEFVGSTDFCGMPLVPFSEVVSRYSPEFCDMFVAIGYKKMRSRGELYDRAKSEGYRLTNYVSTRSVTFGDLMIGENNAIMANTNIEPFVRIGNNNLISADTLLAHEVVIGDHNYLAAKCLIGGRSVVGDYCFVGNGAVVIDGINIRNETHLLPGSVLLKDTKQSTKYMGNPAREIGTHGETGIVVARG